MRLRALLTLPAFCLVAACAGTPFANLTPAQDAQLACLGTTLGAQIAATNANPVKAASYQANGTILCTFATGVAIILTPTTGATTAPVAVKS